MIAATALAGLMLTGPVPVLRADSEVALTSKNTKIEFVCAHEGDKPDPRSGSFGKLTGKAAISGASLASVSVEIETASITTEIDKLTGHLKSADFFDVRQHPKATFKSTKIEAGEDGKVTVTGDLTLLGNTKSISFPATVSTDGGLTLTAKFELDRTKFGMNYGVGKVEKTVTMTIAIAKSESN
jgi:polyisoprenoid-binding protein YceI